MSNIPDRFAIQWLVGRMHVSQGDDEVEKEIRRRLPKDTLPATADAMVEYALSEHHANQNLYTKVMRGNL